MGGGSNSYLQLIDNDDFGYGQEIWEYHFVVLYSRYWSFTFQFLFMLGGWSIDAYATGHCFPSPNRTSFGG